MKQRESLQQEQQILKNSLTEYSEKILQEEKRLQLVSIQLSDIEENWKRYQIYYKEDIIPEENMIENLEERLDGAITAFENENKDVREKNETLQVVREQAEASLKELKKRKADIEKLELLYTQNHLTEVSEEELEHLRATFGAGRKGIKKM